jgi:hypothetical protein
MTEDIKISKRDGQFFILKALNSFSFRFFFFIILVKREKSTNLFFRFLDSFNRNVRVF